MEDNIKIRIGGIKFSEELVQVTVFRTSTNESSFDQLLHLLAGRHINIPFICHSQEGCAAQSSFCVLLDDLGRTQEVLKYSSYACDNIRIIPSVGTLTLFPHRNSFRLLGLIMGFFGKNQYPIHALSTSISAVALNTDFRLLDHLAETLTEVITLPENHAPFRQEFRLTQMY